MGEVPIQPHEVSIAPPCDGPPTPRMPPNELRPLFFVGFQRLEKAINKALTKEPGGEPGQGEPGEARGSQGAPRQPGGARGSQS